MHKIECHFLLPLQSTVTKTDQLIFTTQILRIKVLNVLQYMLKHVCTEALAIFINKQLFLHLYTCAV